MLAMNIEVKVAAISFEHRLIRYLKEFQINRSPIQSEASCCFFLPHSLTLALMIRYKAFDVLAKEFYFTLQCSGSELMTNQIAISEADYEIGHVIAWNASRTGLPSTNLNSKLFQSLENEEIITLELRKERNGPSLATFCFKAIKPKSKEDAIFSSDSPIRFAPYYVPNVTTVESTGIAGNEKKSKRPHKKMKRNEDRKKKSSDNHGKGKGVSGQKIILPSRIHC